MGCTEVCGLSAVSVQHIVVCSLFKLLLVNWSIERGWWREEMVGIAANHFACNGRMQTTRDAFACAWAWTWARMYLF